MSACNCLKQRNAVHLAVDGAQYSADGVLYGIVQKAFAIPTCNAVLAMLGPSGASLIFAYEFGTRFRSFDGLVVGIESAARQIFSEHISSLADAGLAEAEMWIAGWSEARGRAEAYTMHVAPPDSDLWSRWSEDRTDDEMATRPFKLVEVQDIAGNPPVTADERRAAGLSLAFHGELPDELDAAGTLHHLIAIQRQQARPMRPGMPPRHWVGGHILLSTVTAGGVTQRVIHRWADEIGKPITPAPVDWSAWRAKHRPGAPPLAPAPTFSVTFDPPRTMNRRERRALQAQQRRV